MDDYKYVSAVEGSRVARYGSGDRFRNNVTIGATAQGEIDPNIVVRIPIGEWGRYAKEYTRALNDRALVERDEAAYKAWIDAEEKRVNDELESSEERAAVQAAADAETAKRAKQSVAKVEAAQAAKNADE